MQTIARYWALMRRESTVHDSNFDLVLQLVVVGFIVFTAISF